MNTHPPRQFPLTSGTVELSWLDESLGRKFRIELIPMGQLTIASGKLTVGDPLLGFSGGRNPRMRISPGSYSVIQTRLVCLDKERLEVPAYLSLVLDAKAIDVRRSVQAEAIMTDGEPYLKDEQIGMLCISEDGEWLDAGEHDADISETRILSVKSGVVAFVDEDSFSRRMPNPIQSGVGWFDLYFDLDANDSWLKKLDDPHHIAQGVANIALPMGPEDWEDAKRPTIVLAQMATPGDCLFFVEYPDPSMVDEEMATRTSELAPVAIHVTLGNLATF